MAAKKGVANGTKTALEMNKEDDIKLWTSRQVEYLLRRRAAFKGVVTKNSKKAKDIISKNGSRTVLRYVKERVCQALQNASQATQDAIALQSDNVSQRAESEEWLDNLGSEVEDNTDAIEEYVESRADEPPSVIGDISIVADVVSEADDKASQNSESSDGSHVVYAALKFAKLLSKSTQTKEKKSALKSNNEDSDSDEKDTKGDDEDEEKLDSKDFDKMFKGIKKKHFNRFQRRQRPLSRLESAI